MFLSNRHGCRYLDYTIEGNRFLTLENNKLKMTFWLNKGADLIEIRDKASDMDVLWRTPMPMPAAGHYISPASAPIGNFFDYYPGGWQEVFPNAHLPTIGYKGAPLGLHGEVCLLPWHYSVLENTEDIIRIKLFVRTARTPFYIEKTVTLRNHEAFFVFNETIMNEGNEEMFYNWGHHPVFGAPFLEEGCVIDAPGNSIAVLPEKGEAANQRLLPGQRSKWPHLSDVSGQTVDASYILEQHAGFADSFHMEVKEGWAALRNPRLDLGVGLAWELDAFPYLWIWQAYSGSAGYPFYSRNYNVALEPYSVPVETLTESIQNGNAHKLKPQETKSSKLTFGFTQGKTPIHKITLDGRFE
jgi:galactose mutarotase-like enzyme